MTEEHSFTELFFSFEAALNFSLDWIEENFDPEEQFIDVQEIKLMESGAYRAGVILKNKQLDLLYGSTEDA